MTQVEGNECCELGVKGACLTCDYSIFCNGKWSHGEGQPVKA